MSEQAMESSEFLTPAQVAALLQVSRSHVYRLLEERRIASHQIGRARRVRRADLDAYLESCRATGQ